MRPPFGMNPNVLISSMKFCKVEFAMSYSSLLRRPWMIQYESQ